MPSSKSVVVKVIKPKAKSLGKDKPKRATGPFGFFIANSLKTMKTFDKSGEAMKKASESWKKMSDAEKAPYTSLAKKDLDRYHREVNAANANKLKRPPSNYLLFVKEFMRREAGNYPSARDAISAASREWKEMTDHQKAPYTREANTLSTKYKADKAKQDAQAGTAKSPRKKVAASKVKVASLGTPKSRTRAAGAKKPASKAKKTTAKARSASKARKPAARAASKGRKAAPARAASKSRAASKARKPAASKARKPAPARAASKPRSVSKARKTVGKAKKAGGKK